MRRGLVTGLVSPDGELRRAPHRRLQQLPRFRTCCPTRAGRPEHRRGTLPPCSSRSIRCVVGGDHDRKSRSGARSVRPGAASHAAPTEAYMAPPSMSSESGHAAILVVVAIAQALHTVVGSGRMADGYPSVVVGTSIQPNERSTALRQPQWAASRWSSLQPGSHWRSAVQLRRSSSRSVQKPTASPAA